MSTSETAQAEELPEVEVNNHDPLNDPTGYDAPTGEPAESHTPAPMPVTPSSATVNAGEQAKEATAPATKRRGGRRKKSEPGESEDSGPQLVRRAYPAQCDIDAESLLPAQMRES